VEVHMKKILMITLLSVMLASSAFSISLVEKLLLPEFTDDLATVSYKLVESSDDLLIVEINGVTYIYKLK